MSELTEEQITRAWLDFANLIEDAVRNDSPVTLLEEEVQAVSAVTSTTLTQLTYLVMLGLCDAPWTEEELEKVEAVIFKIADAGDANTTCELSVQECKDYKLFSSATVATLLPVYLSNPNTKDFILNNLDKYGITIDDIYGEEL